MKIGTNMIYKITIAIVFLFSASACEADICKNPITTLEINNCLSLKIENAEQEVLTNITATLPSFAFGSWIKAKYGSTEYNIEGNVVEFNDIFILNKTTSDFFTFTFKSNKYSAPGTYSDIIALEGKNNATGNTLQINDLPITITINESKSLTLTLDKKLTKTTNGTLLINNTGNVELAISLTSEENADFSVEFSEDNFNLLPGQAKSITISSEDAKNLRLGDDNKLTITATADGVTKQIEIEVPVSFCEFGEVGPLSIKDFDVNNLDGDDDEWEPLDEIEIEVEVKNTGDEKIKDVIAEIMILDEDGNDVTDDFDLEDNEIDLGDIKSDKKETATFKIDELPADLEEGNYRIYVKAYSENNEDLECVDTYRGNKYHEISINKEKDNAIIVKEESFTTIKANAGDNVEIKFDIYNIGTKDEEDVLVRIYNQELGINEKIHVKDMDVGDKKEISFTVKVPESAEEKKYYIDIYTYFDYDKGDVLDENSYDQNSFDDLDKTYSVPLEVLKTTVEKKPIITATLSSDAIVGKDLIVDVSITNPNKAADFIIAVTDYESWASSADIVPSILNIPENGTGYATITFKPTASGSQTFNIQVIYNGKTETQPVSVNIAEKTTSLTEAFSRIGNKGLYAIIAVFIILIILIIALIVKAASRTGRKEEAEF